MSLSFDPVAPACTYGPPADDDLQRVEPPHDDPLSFGSQWPMTPAALGSDSVPVPASSPPDLAMPDRAPMATAPEEGRGFFSASLEFGTRFGLGVGMTAGTAALAGWGCAALFPPAAPLTGPVCYGAALLGAGLGSGAAEGAGELLFENDVNWKRVGVASVTGAVLFPVAGPLGRVAGEGVKGLLVRATVNGVLSNGVGATHAYVETEVSQGKWDAAQDALYNPVTFVLGAGLGEGARLGIRGWAQLRNTTAADEAVAVQAASAANTGMAGGTAAGAPTEIQLPASGPGLLLRRGPPLHEPPADLDAPFMDRPMKIDLMLRTEPGPKMPFVQNAAAPSNGSAGRPLKRVWDLLDDLETHDGIEPTEFTNGSIEPRTAEWTAKVEKLRAQLDEVMGQASDPAELYEAQTWLTFIEQTLGRRPLEATAAPAAQGRVVTDVFKEAQADGIVLSHLFDGNTRPRTADWTAKVEKMRQSLEGIARESDSHDQQQQAKTWLRFIEKTLLRRPLEITPAAPEAAAVPPPPDPRDVFLQAVADELNGKRQHLMDPKITPADAARRVKGNLSMPLDIDSASGQATLERLVRGGPAVIKEYIRMLKL